MVVCIGGLSEICGLVSDGFAFVTGGPADKASRSEYLAVDDIEDPPIAFSGPPRSALPRSFDSDSNRLLQMRNLGSLVAWSCTALTAKLLTTNAVAYPPLPTPPPPALRAVAALTLT